jgi:HlyD family secretion protein
MKIQPKIIVICIPTILAVLAGLYWLYARNNLPDYVVRSNGRLEFTRLDISTIYPGRVIQLPAKEGEYVKSGDILAVLDAEEVKAQIEGAQAQKELATSVAERSKAEIDVRQNSKKLAQLDFNETSEMKRKSLVSQIELEKRRIGLDSELAGEAAAKAALNGALANIATANAQIKRLEILLKESTIKAPIDGRIEYLIVEQDAVLPAGGRVMSMLDVDDVYMTIFLPSVVAGKLIIGGEARILLDAMSGISLPAVVTYVAYEAQFTPKYVETTSEREKLVYRVKLQIPKEVAQKYRGLLKAGMPGNGYVKTNQDQSWPPFLYIDPSDGKLN